MTVPLIGVPAVADEGKPLTALVMSDTGVTGVVALLLLLAVLELPVLLPACVVIVTAPLAGAGKVLVQVMLELTPSGLGVGLGRQLWVAPGGKLPNTQVGATASLGPLLVQVPLTVMGLPAVTFAGTWVADDRMASGTTVRVAVDDGAFKNVIDVMLLLPFS